MQVLLLAHHYPPETGAAATRWGQLVDFLSKGDFSAEVWTAAPHYPHRRAAQGWRKNFVGKGLVRHFPYLPISQSPLTRIIDQAFTSSAMLLRRPHQVPDVIVATAPGIPMLATGVVLAKRYKVPLVCDIRDSWQHSFVKFPWWNPKRWLGSLLTASMRRSQALIVTTETYANFLREDPQIPAKIETIRSATTRTSPRAAYSLPNESRPLRLIYAGTIGVSQNCGTLVEAAAIVGGDVVVLDLYGWGNEFESVSELSAEIPNVRVHRAISTAELDAKLRECDGAVVTLDQHPAYEMTVPSKLYSLMATGVLVTGPIAGESAEIIRQSKAGFTVPPGSAESLARLWTDLWRSDALHEPGFGVSWLEENALIEVTGARLSCFLKEVYAGWVSAKR